MNDRDIQLIKDSFERIEDSGMDYAQIFYDILFTQTPSTKALFKRDMEEQKEKLRTTVKIAVKGLEKFEQLRIVIFELGKRHINYGVHKDDFPDVKDAFIETINLVLPDLTTEEEDAWTKALNIISNTMLEAYKKEA